jgi:hypothetical protein
MTNAEANEDPSQNMVSIMAPISAGKDRIKSMVALVGLHPHVKSWRITMDFDPEGDLMSYWESSLDENDSELIGGGISSVETPFRGGTTTCKGFRLSPLQVKALLAGLGRKLDRSTLGWVCDERVLPTDYATLFRSVTIRSLHKRGLLDANFTDKRVLDGDTRGVQNLDDARHEHSPEASKFQVWTNSLGREILAEMGFIGEDG